MKRLLLVIASLSLILLSALALSATKISYNDNNIFFIDDFTFLDTVSFDKGIIVIGKNGIGPIEAVIIPRNNESYEDRKIEYLYMRFDPIWFFKNVRGKLETADSSISLNEIEEIRNDNFRNYMHWGDRPIVIPSVVAGNIKVENLDRKFSFIKGMGFEDNMSNKLTAELPSWNQYSLENLRIYYPPDSIISDEIKDWTENRHQALHTISRELGVVWQPEDIIKIYVFDSFEHGREYGLNLGFANPRNNEIYTRFNQTEGHELTHVISYHINEGKRINSALINEGMATYYDLTGRDYKELAGRSLMEENWDVDLFGSDFRKNRDAYTLGASFVQFLVESYGKETFISFFAQDEYSETESFKEFYGKKPNQLYLEWIDYLKSHI